MKPENILTAILLVLVLAICATSCTSASGHRTEQPKSLLSNITRVKVLETNTINYVKLDSIELKVYRPLDTVWVNLATHTIDESEFTMQCVLYSTNN